MAALVRTISFFSLCGILAAATASATVPNPATSTCPGCGGPGSTPPYVRIVGFNTSSLSSSSLPAGAAHAGTAFTVCIRNNLGAPVENALVEARFINCNNTFKLCTVIPSGAPNQMVDCDLQIVSARTNAGGFATLQIVGGGVATGASPPAGCAQLTVDQVPFTTLSVVVYDANGASGGNGVTPLDLSYLLADLKAAGAPTFTYASRSDYSCTGAAVSCGTPLTPLDVSYFLQILVDSTVLANGSAGGCPSLSGPPGPDYCP